MTYHLLFTIDVEDWFQVENFKQYIPFSSWSSHELRVEKNTHRLLNLLDSASSHHLATRNSQPETRNPIYATFFVLGWIAERLPHLVKEISSRGHEIASHGYYHHLCNDCSPDDLKKDLIKSKSLLEDIVGFPVYGYRAPSFSISDDTLKIIEDCGYLYDSSYNSFAIHGRYGQISPFQNGQKGIAYKIPRTPNSKLATRNSQLETFYELPISNLRFAHQVFPWGGGGYFRLIPFPLFRLGVRSILKKENAYLFYMHPWEIDENQPRVDEAFVFYKFRHYINLSKTHRKLSKLIESFAHCNFITCSQYLNEVMKSAL